MIHFQFVRDHYEKGDIDLCHVDTHKQFTEILKKPQDQATFARLREELYVCFSF